MQHPFPIYLIYLLHKQVCLYPLSFILLPRWACEFFFSYVLSLPPPWRAIKFTDNSTFSWHCCFSFLFCLSYFHWFQVIVPIFSTQQTLLLEFFINNLLYYPIQFWYSYWGLSEVNLPVVPTLPHLCWLNLTDHRCQKRKMGIRCMQ